MRAHVRRVKRPLAEDSPLCSAKEDDSGVENLRKLFEKVSLREVSLEERRKEAGKPLYLVRYE